MEWLFWQVGNLGPMAGQLSHFVNYAQGEHPYSHQRYANEYNRCLGVLERRLEGSEFIVDEYSIADMCCWPWVLIAKPLGQALDEFPNVARWREAVKRPAGGAARRRSRQGMAPLRAALRRRAQDPVQPDRPRRSRALSTSKEKSMPDNPRWKRRPHGSTWGDLGPDDQLGRLNLITPEKVRKGVAEVKEGKTFCLSLPLDYPGGNVLNPRRHPPVLMPTERDGMPN